LRTRSLQHPVKVYAPYTKHITIAAGSSHDVCDGVLCGIKCLPHQLFAAFEK
jgi:hypothetical protein